MIRTEPDRIPGSRGASAVEYALLASLVAGATIATMVVFGQDVLGLFEHTSTSVNDAVAP